MTSLTINRGEVLGLVGESGSGKSTFIAVATHADHRWRHQLDGVDMRGLENNDLKNMRRRMQMIFQDPYASLNPRTTVYDTLQSPCSSIRWCQKRVLMAPLEP